MRRLVAALLLAGCHARGGVMPTAQPRVRTRAGSCSPAEVEQFIAGCIDPDTALVIRCQQFASNHPACEDCLRPTGAAQNRGPLVEYPGGLRANLPGCRLLAPAQRKGSCVAHGDPLDDVRAVVPVFCGR